MAGAGTRPRCSTAATAPWGRDKDTELGLQPPASALGSPLASSLPALEPSAPLALVVPHRCPLHSGRGLQGLQQAPSGVGTTARCPPQHPSVPGRQQQRWAERRWRAEHGADGACSWATRSRKRPALSPAVPAAAGAPGSPHTPAPPEGPSPQICPHRSPGRASQHPRGSALLSPSGISPSPNAAGAWAVPALPLPPVPGAPRAARGRVHEGVRRSARAGAVGVLRGSSVRHCASGRAHGTAVPGCPGRWGVWAQGGSTGVPGEVRGAMEPSAEHTRDWAGTWPAVAGRTRHPCWYRMAVPELPPAPLQARWQISAPPVTGA